MTGAVLFAGSQAVLATPITISDRVNSGTNPWYRDRENDEVEPGCVTGQAWDLESFDLTGTTLTLTGGWNFRNGHQGDASGDLFIDANRNAVWGQDVFGGSGDGNRTEYNSACDYYYVIQFNQRSSTTIGAGGYQVIRPTENARVVLTTSYYRQNDESSPWVYGRGGSVEVSGTATFGQFDDHYTMAVDVGFLGDVSDARFKFTIER